MWSTWTAIAIVTASARASTPPIRANDTVTGVLGIATGGPDPRSSNQTLTDQNSRKDFELDLGYVQWAPNAEWRFTAGKQRYPWQRTAGLFYDGDVNPEGIAINYTKGNFFAATWYDWLAERALSFSNTTNGTNTDSIMFGGQVGYRFAFSDSARLTVAATYFDFDGVQGWNPLFGGSSFGNTTVVGAAGGCNRTFRAPPRPASRLTSTSSKALPTSRQPSVAGRCASSSTTRRTRRPRSIRWPQEKLDTAMAAGFSYGAATAVAGTWEFGVTYQQIEKDSLFGQLVDSDFGDGNTDTDGYVLRGGYTVARNWTLNATLFLNSLSNDVPQSVTVFNEATPAPLDTTTINGIFDRDYKRLQLDLNFRF